jgi:PAS domain S-box-containing protein
MKFEKINNPEVLEHHYKYFFKYANDIIILLDDNLKIIETNDKAVSVYGYTREEMSGMEFSKLHSKSGHLPVSAFKEELDEKGSVIFETIHVKKDYSEFPSEISASLIEINGVRYYQMIGRDISNRKTVQSELLIEKERALENDRLKTAFLHNISHEIRTPLNAIVGFSALISEPDIDNSTRRSYANTIINSSDSLLAIISDIIDFSYIEANIVQVSGEAFHLNSVMKSLYERFLLRSNETGITLIVETGLTDNDSMIYTDKIKLIHICTNLLHNAFKFTRQGQIIFGYTVKDKLLEFFVSDTGLGIDKKYHQKIFDRFFQVEDPLTKYHAGTGLGLSICKAYIGLLGGEISLSSFPGEGSAFVFTIPFEKPAESETATLSKLNVNGFRFPMNKKILIAEDIDSNYKLIEKYLYGTNVEVFRASNGKEAVEIFLSVQNLDLILMDIKMPLMDGYEATKVIRESNTNIPIIAQSAYTDDEIRVLECGFSSIIIKPYNKGDLIKTIKEYI